MAITILGLKLQVKGPMDMAWVYTLHLTMHTHLGKDSQTQLANFDSVERIEQIKVC